MKVVISKENGSLQWNGVYYFGLSQFPSITDWDLKTLVKFVEYEKRHNRKTEFTCENDDLLQRIHYAVLNPETVLSVKIPDELTNCNYCLHKMCFTRFLCHTSDVESAKSILSGGEILSAVNVRKTTGIELAQEPRNAAGDPPDYFDYIMLSWGNCPAGDKLVTERKSGRFPNEADLGINFSPGIRFFFEYKAVIEHPAFVFDGYHSAKIKDRIKLSDNLSACIIPKHLENEMCDFIPPYLKNKTFFIEHSGEDLLKWTEKVYGFIDSVF